MNGLKRNVSLLLTSNAENRRFVEVIVKGQKRFEALRDFTVDGALEEVDRMTRERKDAGEPTGVRSPVRNASLDSARSPVSARSPPLRDVPEDSAFAIGDDEDDPDDDEGDVDEDLTPMNASASAADADGAVPLQSRSMSEKARGKQPINQTSFSRSASRNTSNTSLTTLTPLQTSHTSNTSQISTTQQSFTPTPEWVSRPRLFSLP